MAGRNNQVAKKCCATLTKSMKATSRAVSLRNTIRATNSQSFTNQHTNISITANKNNFAVTISNLSQSMRINNRNMIVNSTSNKKNSANMRVACLTSRKTASTTNKTVVKSSNAGRAVTVKNYHRASASSSSRAMTASKTTKASSRTGSIKQTVTESQAIRANYITYSEALQRANRLPSLPFHCLPPPDFL